LLCCPHSLCGLSPESTFSSADDWVWSLMRCCDAQVAAGLGWVELSWVELGWLGWAGNWWRLVTGLVTGLLVTGLVAVRDRWLGLGLGLAAD
jgi:hypothetical protein